MVKLSQTIKGLWSLVVGLKVTGIEFFKPKLTVHYPRKEVDNLGTYRGHCDLVAKENDPYTPKCIMCGLCVDNCPSSCLRLTMHVVGDDRPRPTTGGDGELLLAQRVVLPGSVRKAPPPQRIERVLDSFTLNYNLCSLCGLCVQNCPVSSLTWSREVYLCGRSRRDFQFDLLGRLRAKVAAKQGEKAA
jgi:NADH-quinone oxidoreductase subunit I